MGHFPELVRALRRRFSVVDTSVLKVNARQSPHGQLGQTYLASGLDVSMRLWEEQPGHPKPATSREYETVGYVIGGKAELYIEGQMLILEAGDSWVVPEHVSHAYRIVEPFTAVEATSPPASAHGRDRV
jgi:quercetin dioxygenase-like cupin family protein